jgi:glycerol-3-phosphate dehydrogenase
VSTGAAADVEVAVIGAGVVGCAAALAIARRGATVSLLEAEDEPAFGASGANSGILHTGFDSIPGQLETELILAAAAAREPVLKALDIPVLRCGALIAPRYESQCSAVALLVAGASRNGVQVVEHANGTLEVPGETVTDPVAYTLGLAAEAGRHGCDLRTRFRVVAITRDGQEMTVSAEDGRTVRCRIVVNCAGLQADTVARLLGDESFSIYPRKGEFLVFDPPGGKPLERILLPVPTPRTKGVLVFPTIDGKVVTGPTAVDLDDKRDRSVRPEARAEIIAKAVSLYPELEGAEPIASYAGLRTAGRGVNYLIGPSNACPQLVNVAAIRSTGLSASLGIGDYVARLVNELGVRLGDARGLVGGEAQASPDSWWLRASHHGQLA